MCCAFKDALLQTSVVTNGYLSNWVLSSAWTSLAILLWPLGSTRHFLFFSPFSVSPKDGCAFSWREIKYFSQNGHYQQPYHPGCPLRLSRVEPGQYLDGSASGKTRLLLEEVLVRPAGGAHPVVCVGPNGPKSQGH